MILYRAPAYIILLICLVTIYGLFKIKDNVMSLRYELSEINKQLAHEENAIKILKAEFAYLSSPQRIQQLADKYLNLKEIRTTQIVKDPLLDNSKNKTTTASNNFKLSNKESKWIYKKGPTKYLIMTKGGK